MENISSQISGNHILTTGLGRTMQAEEHFCKVTRQIMKCVSSAEFYRMLGHVLALSEQHQQKLMGSFGMVAATSSETAADEFEQHIDAVACGKQTAAANDLTYTWLITKIIQRKIDCYEQVLSIIDSQQLHHHKRILGAALSDETATELFMQELAERLFLRQFPEHASLA